MQPAKPKDKGAAESSTQTLAIPGQCLLLKAVTVTRAGAFMSLGSERDLLVPVSQQLQPIMEGKSYVVYLFLDPKQQLIGSTKLHKFLDERAKDMAPGQAVDLLIVNKTEMGYKAVVDGTHLGLLYKDEVFRELHPGDKIRGYIKSIREDRKIDLCLQGQVSRERQELSERILAYLEAHDGISALTDYSPPDAIYQQYGVSKGNYKKALGKLYKQRRISVSKDKITLL